MGCRVPRLLFLCCLLAVLSACVNAGDDGEAAEAGSLGRVYAVGSVGGPDCPILSVDEGRFTVMSPAGVEHVMLGGLHDAVPLAVPPTIDALVGQPLEIYFDNLIRGHGPDHAWSVCAPTGVQTAHRWSMSAESAGSVPLHIVVWDGGRSSPLGVAFAQVRVHPTDAGAGQGPKVLFLGDSTTASGEYIADLQERMSADVMSVQPVGTLPPAKRIHEGRSGWRIATYHSQPKFEIAGASAANPFLFDDQFDFGRYLTEHDVPKPDAFVVALGTNDVYAIDHDDVLAARIDQMLVQLDDIIASVLAAEPDMAVAIGLTIVPCSTESGFVASYGVARRARVKRNIVQWAQAAIDHYRSRPGIDLIALNARIDPMLGYPTAPGPAGKVRHTNALHPSDVGYGQMAATIHAWLKGAAVSL